MAPWAAADDTVTYGCGFSHHVLLGPIVVPWGELGKWGYLVKWGHLVKPEALGEGGTPEEARHA